MSLQLILGGSGSGKTRLLYETLIEKSMENETERFFLIVPEQFTMQTQKEIVTLHPCHGTMNIDIVSFERLAYRVFEELAVDTLAVLDDMGKSMVLRKVAAIQKKNLGIYKGHLNQAGFISQLKSMLSEMFQYGVTKEKLEEMSAVADSPILKQKLDDFSVIFRGFQEYTEGRFVTTEEILDVLCRVLPQSCLMEGGVTALDGFTGFTPVQYRVIGQFLRQCKKVMVTVTIDAAADAYREARMQDLFYMSRHTVCKLMTVVGESGAQKEEDIVLKGRPSIRFEGRDALDFLERELYRYSNRTFKKDQNEIQIVRACNPAEEVAYVTGRILDMVREEGLRFRDIAVITGDLAGYGNEIIRQFESGGIPYFLDDKKSILANPMVELIRASLEIVRRDFDYESVFRYLKTGLATDKKEQIDRLENYVVALGIRGYRRWNSVWEAVYRGGKNLNMAELNEFREEILAPLSRLYEAFKTENASVQDMTKALTEFLMELEIEQKMREFEQYFEDSREFQRAKEYRQVYGLVMGLFDRLVGLLGDEKVSRREYGEILDAGFGEIKVGVIPAVVDRVLVGDIKRTRLDHIEVLVFIGVNDGVVPVRKEGGSLLSDREREFLGSHRMELAPTAREEGLMQRFYLYLMMTKPRQRLMLSYSAVTAEGKSQRQSSLIGQVQKLFPGLAVMEADHLMRVSSAAAGKEALARGLSRYEETRKDRRFLELYRAFYLSPEYREEVEKYVRAAFYTYEKQGIGKAAARALYGSSLGGSVTRLERYASCAYAHFLNYGLELMERQVYELAAFDIGNLFHSSIDLCFKTANEMGRSLAAMSPEERGALVSDCVNRVTEEYGNTILKSSARNAYLAKRVGRITDRTIWALAEQMKKGDFNPVGFEVSFSVIDNLKAMKIALSEEETLNLQGRIDRLDICEDETHVYVKIIDYKSGNTGFDLAALYYGLQLQLVVYMDAAVEMVERRNPEKEVVPAGLFYYHIDDPLAEKREGMEAGDIDGEILRQLCMNGLVNSELEVIRHLDRTIEKQSDVIPVAMKDGVIQEAKSSVANRRRFEALGSFVKQKLKEAGREILDGRIDINPYKQGDRTACGYCPYHAVCGFDRKTGGYEYNRLKPLKAGDVWGEIDKKEEDKDGV